MANPEQLEMLKRSVREWNQWRKENPNAIVNLSGAELEGAVLNGADLRSAHLLLANLKKAILREADLENAGLNLAYIEEADLSGANLVGALLSRANLVRADLRFALLGGANLTEAILPGAKLENADLHKADLEGADLEGADLREVDFHRANLHRANLEEANLVSANLQAANLKKANLHRADLRNVNLSGANFINANLREANLCKADLTEVNLEGTNLNYSLLIKTDLSNATISDCKIYGISAWGVKLDGIKSQSNLRVTPDDEPPVYVDNLEVAQFVYLLLHNEKIRSVLDTIGEKGVLILGRFTEERKAVLDAIRNKLRELGFVPMMFDFEKPTKRDFTETIKTLAGLSRFIIADITNPSSVPMELQAVVPNYMVPLVPILEEGKPEFGMFRDLKQKYGEWVLDVLEYDSAESLMDVMDDAVVQPALDKAYELIDRKAEDLKRRHVRDYKKRSEDH